MFFLIPSVITLTFYLFFSPPSRNSDSASLSLLFFPLSPTTLHFFIARRLQSFLPSSTRIESMSQQHSHRAVYLVGVLYLPLPRLAAKLKLEVGRV